MGPPIRSGSSFSFAFCFSSCSWVRANVTVRLVLSASFPSFSWLISSSELDSGSSWLLLEFMGSSYSRSVSFITILFIVSSTGGRMLIRRSYRWIRLDNIFLYCSSLFAIDIGALASSLGRMFCWYALLQVEYIDVDKSVGFGRNLVMFL